MSKDISIEAFAAEVIGEIRNEVDNEMVWIPYGTFPVIERHIIVNRNTSDIGIRYNEWLAMLEEAGALLYRCAECGYEEAGKLEDVPEGWTAAPGLDFIEYAEHSNDVLCDVCGEEDE